jgi:hypothetical protein
MSFSFGSKTEKTKSSASSDVDPWDVAIPALKDFIGEARTISSRRAGPTTAQTGAINELKANAAQGNPFEDEINRLAGDLFGSESYSPEVSAGYADFQRRLDPVADGANLDIGNNEYIQNLLKTVGDDIQWRTNSTFAGAGRDMSGINQQAVARGITQGTAPILLDQYNREQGRTDAAARDLFSGSNTAATTKANLDSSSASLRGAGIDASRAAMEARDAGPNAILNLEEQLKQMPYQELSWLAELLYPAAGLGGQTEEEGKSKSKGTSFGAGLKLI